MPSYDNFSLTSSIQAPFLLSSSFIIFLYVLNSTYTGTKPTSPVISRVSSLYICDSKETHCRPAVPEIKDFDRSDKDRFNLLRQRLRLPLQKSDTFDVPGDDGLNVIGTVGASCQ